MIKFEDVKVGDRVKLTSKTGDIAEVTITEEPPYGQGVLESDEHLFWTDKWSVTEILEKPVPDKLGTILKWPGESSGYVKTGEGWRYLKTDQYLTDEVVKSAYRNAAPGAVEVIYNPGS